MKKSVLLTFVLTLLMQLSAFAQYSLYVKEAEYLDLVCPVSDGYIRSAVWSSDSDYIYFEESSETGAIVWINHYFEGVATVKATFTYLYRDFKGDMRPAQGVDYFTLSCKPIPFKIDKDYISLKVGEKESIHPSYPPEYSGWTGSIMYEWSSSNDNVAEVPPSGYTGVVTGRYHGTAIITFDPIVGPPLFCEVRVTADPPTGVSVTPEEITIKEGKSTTFHHKFTPNNSYAEVKWSSSNESVATVTNGGVVKGVSEGSAEITVITDNGLSASGSVNVLPVPKQVKIPSNISIPMGYAVQMAASIVPAHAETSLSWSIANPEIATVNDNGLVMGKKPGTAILTVTTDNKVSATALVTVVEADEGMEKKNVEIRVQALKDLVNSSLKYLK